MVAVGMEGSERNWGMVGEMKEGEDLSKRREERNEPSETTELVKNGRNEKSQTCKISG